MKTLKESLVSDKLLDRITQAMKFCDNVNKMKKVESDWDEEFPDDIYGDVNKFMEDRRVNCKLALDNTYIVLEEGYVTLTGNSKKDEEALTEMVVDMMRDGDAYTEFHEPEEYVEFAYHGIWKALFGHPITNDLKK